MGWRAAARRWLLRVVVFAFCFPLHAALLRVRELRLAYPPTRVLCCRPLICVCALLGFRLIRCCLVLVFSQESFQAQVAELTKQLGEAQKQIAGLEVGA